MASPTWEQAVMNMTGAPTPQQGLMLLGDPTAPDWQQSILAADSANAHAGNTIQEALDVAALKVTHETQAQATTPAWPVAMANWQYRQKITADASMNSQIVKLNVHHGIRRSGDLVADELFCADGCNTDFSDLRFTTSDGATALNYRLLGHGNCEVINDGSRFPLLGFPPIICPTDFPDANLSAGDIILAGAIDGVGGVHVSSDNGNTWDSRNANAYAVAFLDSTGVLYATRTIAPHTTVWLYYSTDGGTTWAESKDLGGTNSDTNILPKTIIEDSSGYIWIGLYKANQTNGYIYRSNAPVATWDHATFGTDRNPGLRASSHIHFLQEDPYNPGTIWAGMDGAANGGLRYNTNADTTWTAAGATTSTSTVGTQLVFTEDYIFILTPQFLSGSALVGRIARTDLTTWTTVVAEQTYGHFMRVHNGLLIAAGRSNTAEYTPKIYMVDLNADPTGASSSWQVIYEFAKQTDVLKGWNWDNGGTPTGDDYQYLIASVAIDAGIVNARLYPGGDHYQALVYVDIAEATGTTMYMYYGNEDAATTSTNIFTYQVPAAAIGRWSFNNSLTPALNAADYTTLAKNSISGGGGGPTNNQAQGRYTTVQGATHMNESPLRVAGYALQFCSLAQSVDRWHWTIDLAGTSKNTLDAADGTPGKEISALAWCKLAVYNASIQAFFCKGAVSATTWGLGAATNTGQMMFMEGALAGAGRLSPVYFPLGEWCQAGFILRADGKTVDFIFNGTILPAQTLASTVTANTVGIGIGGCHVASGVDTWYKYGNEGGCIDELTIIPGIITQAEVTAHYEMRPAQPAKLSWGDPSGQFALVNVAAGTWTERLNIGPNIDVRGSRATIIDNHINVVDAKQLNRFQVEEDRVLTDTVTGAATADARKPVEELATELA